MWWRRPFHFAGLRMEPGLFADLEPSYIVFGHRSYQEAQRVHSNTIPLCSARSLSQRWRRRLAILRRSTSQSCKPSARRVPTKKQSRLTLPHMTPYAARAPASLNNVIEAVAYIIRFRGQGIEHPEVVLFRPARERGSSKSTQVERRLGYDAQRWTGTEQRILLWPESQDFQAVGVAAPLARS